MKQQIIVLVGGGHAHLEVIRRFSEQSLAGRFRVDLRLILICPDSYSVYSGMLPGVIAGHYQPFQAKIGLKELCSSGPVEWLQERVVKLDSRAKCLYLSGGERVTYDIVSLDVGSETSTVGIEGETAGTEVKPVSVFLDRWCSFASQYEQQSQGGTLVVIGGGVAGVELLLAAKHRLPSLQCHLISSAELLKGHNALVKSKVKSIINKRRISLREYCTVKAVWRRPDKMSYEVQLSDGSSVEGDFVLLATQARPHEWLRSSSLPITQQGFVSVNSSLQVLGNPAHFAVGDAAGFDPPIAKAGVYPVRQGPVLAYNLLAEAAGKPLQIFQPQSRFLSLIATGEKHAIASHGWFYCSGRWVWKWKDFIDQGFVGRYQA